MMKLYRKVRGRTHRRRMKRKSRITKNVSGSDSQHQEDTSQINNLLIWMIGNGFKPSKKLCPTVFPETGRGLMTKEVISEGDTVISIPESLLLTVNSVLNSYLGNIFQRYLHNYTATELLCTFLMCEKLRGDASFWSAYIFTLPTSYTTPAFYKQSLVQFLPQDLYQKVVEQEEKICRSYDQIQPLLRDLEREIPSLKDMLTLNLYKWAWFTVSTRCIYKEQCEDTIMIPNSSNNIAMAPFLDLLNHSSEARVKAGYETETKQYKIISLKSYKRYQQVFINYGGHSNRDLLFHYGFLLQNNPNDMVPVTIDELFTIITSQGSKCEAQLKLKKEFLKNRNLLKTMGCGHEGLTWSLEVAFKFLISKCYRNEDLNSLFVNITSGINHEYEMKNEYKAQALSILTRKLRDSEGVIKSLENECNGRDEHVKLVHTLLLDEHNMLQNAIKQL